MKNIIKSFLFLFFGTHLFAAVYGAELMPWTETDFVFYPRFEYLFQHYDKVHSAAKSESRKAYDDFYTLGISGSYAVWSLDLEITAANTRHRSFGLDDFRITGRYQLMNDIIGNPVSVMVGATYIAATKTALDDISSFHHGRNEGKLHISVGKETPCYNTWLSRWWAVGAIGMADRGSAWFEAMGNWEKNFSHSTFFRLFARGSFGLGGHTLRLDRPFCGYGSIKQRSVDLGFRLTKATFDYGTWYIEYAKRVFAYNFPAGADLLKITVIYPIPL